MVNFNNVPADLTKHWLLSKFSEEEIFTFYGLTIRDDKFCSPLRNDSRPTCNFYRDKTDKLIYRDWATNHHFDAIGFVQWKFDISFGQALLHIWSNMIRQNPNSSKITIKSPIYISKKEPSRIRIKKRKINSQDINFWRQNGLSIEVLNFYNVYMVERAWLNDEPFYLYSVNDPCYAYHLGYEEYKLYFPLRKEYRFLSSTRRVQGEKQLPTNAQRLVITKSLKDVMLLYRFGIAAIALQGETLVPDNDLIKKYGTRFEQITMFYDNDMTGILAMQKAKKVIPCVWIPRRYDAKDITDYYQKYGRDATYELIFYAIKKVNNYLQSQNASILHA